MSRNNSENIHLPAYSLVGWGGSTLVMDSGRNSPSQRAMFSVKARRKVSAIERGTEVAITKISPKAIGRTIARTQAIDAIKAIAGVIARTQAIVVTIIVAHCVWDLGVGMTLMLRFWRMELAFCSQVLLCTSAGVSNHNKVPLSFKICLWRITELFQHTFLIKRISKDT